MKYYLHITLIFALLFFNQIQADEKKPAALTWNNDVKQLLYDDDVKISDGSEFMSLVTPYRALDAAIVPITVNFKVDQKKKRLH